MHRFWASLIAFTLLFPAGSCAVYAQTETESALPESLSLENLALPKSLGKIEERFQGTSNRWVVQIQDVHAHMPAQENIAALVDHLSEVYNIKTLGLEGGWGQTSFPKSRALPNSREKQSLARSLMENDYITGPAYTALFSQSPLTLIGIEHQELYEKNRQAYLNHMKNPAPMTEKIEAMGKELSAAKETSFNAALKPFDSALTDFREGKKAEIFLPLMMREASERDIDFSDLGQVLLFQQALEMEKGLDQEKLKEEAGRLMKAYKTKRLGFEELLKSGFIPKERLEHYPTSRLYLDLLDLQSRISYKLFFEELEVAISRVQETLFTNEEEKELAGRWERFLVAKHILTLKATPDVIRYYAEEQVPLESEIREAGLETSFRDALEFYSLAMQRDRVFFEAVSSDPRLSENIVVVAGGFHTQGLSDRLREAGISYCVITPDLGNAAPDETLYASRMEETVSSSETLSALQNRFFPASFDSGFVRAMEYRKTNRNDLKAMELVFASQAVAAASARTDAPALSWETFSSWSREEKTARLREWILHSREGALRALLAIKASDLSTLLEDPPAEALWENAVRSERANTVVLIYESLADIPIAAIGGKFKVHRFQGSSVAEIVGGEDFTEKFRDLLNEETVAVVAHRQEGPMDQRILRLPNSSPVSFLYRVFLSNPELRTLVKNPDFFSEAQSILKDVENIEAFLGAA